MTVGRSSGRPADQGSSRIQTIRGEGVRSLPGRVQEGKGASLRRGRFPGGRGWGPLRGKPIVIQVQRHWEGTWASEEEDRGPKTEVQTPRSDQR